MARHSIVEKLSRELSQSIETERQVVYLLVEVRKLVELGQDAGRYDTLKFCCDWIAHPLLTGPMAQQIVRQFDKAHQQTEAIHEAAAGQRVDLDWGFMREFEAIVRLSTFREQLTTYLQSHDLDPMRATSDEHWPMFVAHFARIIEDCPLRLLDASLEHTNEVILKVVDVRPDDEAIKVGYKVAIEWKEIDERVGKDRDT